MFILLISRSHEAYFDLFKYTTDFPLKNGHWSAATGIFGKKDVGRIEREFLKVLDWNLAISENEILDHHDSLMESSPHPCHHSHSLRCSRPTTTTAVSPTHAEHCTPYWSDSDSDGSTSPSLVAPHSTPSDCRPLFVESVTVADHDVQSPQPTPPIYTLSEPRSRSTSPIALMSIRLIAFLWAPQIYYYWFKGSSCTNSRPFVTQLKK